MNGFKFKFFSLFLIISIFKSINCYQVRVANQNSLLDEDQTSARIALLACSNDTTRLPNVFYNINENKWMASKRIAACKQSNEDIYALCKKIYPNKRIENIIESNNLHEFEIYTDDLDAKLLGKQYRRPYTCLFGQYKSIALNVPLNCEFKHVYDENTCETKDYWIKYAQNKCTSDAQVLNRSLILQWCDSNSLNKHTGVQFVCCSKPDLSLIDENKIKNDEDYDIDTYYDINDYNDQQGKDSNEIITENDEIKLSKTTVASSSSTTKKVEFPLDDEDLTAIDGDLDEQARYAAEKDKVIENFSIKSRLLINDWHRERDVINKDDVEKLNELDKSYNNKLQKLDEEKQRLLVQTELIHSDIIDKQINERKTKAQNDLSAFKVNTNLMGNMEMFRNLLKNFIKTYEQDRLHQLTLYKRLNTFDLVNDGEFTKHKDVVIQNLRDINKTVEEKMGAVKQLSMYKSKLESSLSSFQTRYESLRKDASFLIEQFDASRVGIAPLNSQFNSDEIDDSFNDVVDDLQDDQDYLDGVKGPTTTTIQQQETLSTTTTTTSTKPKFDAVESDENLYDDDNDDNDDNDTTEDSDYNEDDDIDDDEDASIEDTPVNAQTTQKLVINNEIDDDDDDYDESSEEYVDDDLSKSLESLLANENNPQMQSDSRGANKIDLAHEKMSLRNFSSANSLIIYFVIATCVTVLLILTIIGLIIRKRHMTNGGYYTNAYRPLDQEQCKIGQSDEKLLNREERYVNHMQIHGFVNPMHSIADQNQNV